MYIFNIRVSSTPTGAGRMRRICNKSVLDHRFFLLGTAGKILKTRHRMQEIHFLYILYFFFCLSDNFDVDSVSENCFNFAQLHKEEPTKSNCAKFLHFNVTQRRQQGRRETGVMIYKNSLVH